MVWITVPYDPTAGGEEIAGRTIRAVHRAAAIVITEGHTVETLRRLPAFHAVTYAAAAVRTAVRWGLIPSREVEG